jgi:glyoxylase-like metal-dependent hydrolase (beta-lactamase superfamily II)
MPQGDIITETGKINDYIHLLDLREFGMPKILASFICVFDDGVVILDTGSSLEVKRIWRYAKRNKIPLSSIKYIIPSQHHFDHAGGAWKLYDEIKKYNPDVKILTNQKTKELLNDSEHHLSRAKRTYKEFAGLMNSIEESAFKLINPSSNFTNNPNSLDFIETFHKNGTEIKLAIMKTPGHTPDHQCPLFIRNNEIDFLYSGEAVGTIYHSSKLVSMPTSMPIYFNYELFMNTLDNLLKLKSPLMLGFTHFGVINGKENVRYFMEEHKSFLMEFRSKVIQYYGEKPETKYVYEKLFPFLATRTDFPSTSLDDSALKDIILAVVYGMMLDLGYRELDDKDKQMIEKYRD